MPDFSTNGTILIRNVQRLDRVDYGIEHGEWTKKPPAWIDRGEFRDDFKLKDTFGPYGSEGWARYRTHDGAEITIRFACPSRDDNYARIECKGPNSEHYRCSVEAYSGDAPYNTGDKAKNGHPYYATFAIVDARGGGWKEGDPIPDDLDKLGEQWHHD